MVASDFKIKVLPLSVKLLRITVRFLKNKEEGQDVVQDVMLKLWQKREELDGISNIEAYAVQMIRNRCLDILRKKKVILIDEEAESQIEEITPDIHSQIELSEAAGQIKKLIRRLNGLQRQVMELRDIEQLSYKEIAEITNLKVNAIRVNLSRARKKVRNEFLKMNSDGNEKSKTIAATLF
jgi:RNA polymerase sigma factor (sigma-70 family)